MRMKNVLAVAIFSILSSSLAIAQNGEKLFKSNCAACHNIDRLSTGPALQGSRQRWIDNSSEENFYKWILNSKQVIDEGDQYAIQLFDKFNQSVMTPQAISRDDIDSIFAYVENPPPPPQDMSLNNDQQSTIKVEANYSGLFWILVMVMGVLTLWIVIMADSINSVLGSKKLKKNVKDNEHTTGLKTLLILITFGLLPTDSFAFDFDFHSEYCVNVSIEDIYLLLGLDVILLCILLYLRKILYGLVDQFSTKVARSSSKRKKKTFIQTLTRRVPLAKEMDILMDHEYDGIQELDNNLPPWWKWGFYVSIVFAFCYMTYYHVLGIGNSELQDYEIEMTKANEARQKWLDEMAMNVDENTATPFTDALNIREGQKVYDINCKVCHGNEGEGTNGPNLTDDYWKHGNDVRSLFISIKYGRSNGDMPSHEEKLNPVQIQQVASFVKQLEYVPGKAPEGDFIEDEKDDTLVPALQDSVIVKDNL